MFCPNCESEYIDGIDRCPSCDVPLVGHLNTPSTPVEPAPELCVVLSSTRAEAIAVAKSILIDAEIPFGVRGEEVQDLFGYGRFPSGSSVLMGPVQIMVAPSDKQVSRELLARLQDDAEEEPQLLAEDEGESTRSVWALARPISKVAVWLMLGALILELVFVLASNLMNSDWVAGF